MKIGALFVSVVLLACLPPKVAMAQNTFLVFPQIVDGVAGTVSYKSTLAIQNAFSSTAADCTIRTYGLQLSILGASNGPVIGPSSSFNVQVAANGWNYIRTTGLQSLASGYATLTCSTYVYAHASYSLYAGNGVTNKLGEAAIFGTNENYLARFIADQTEGARLGIAIANNTDIAHDYKVTVTNTAGGSVGTATIRVPGRTSLSRFVDEIIGGTSNQISFIQIQASDFSQFSAIGLRFTGTTFSTVPGY